MRLMSLEKSWQRLKQWLTSVLERENLLSPNFTQDSTVKFGMIYIQMKEISRQYKERGLRTEKRTVRCFSMVSGIKSLKQTGLRHRNQWLSNWWLLAVLETKYLREISLLELVCLIGLLRTDFITSSSNMEIVSKTSKPWSKNRREEQSKQKVSINYLCFRTHKYKMMKRLKTIMIAG